MSVHILIQEVDGDNADSTEACPYCEGTQEGATHEVIFLLAPWPSLFCQHVCLSVCTCELVKERKFMIENTGEFLLSIIAQK